MKSTKEILVVSFGTTVKRAREQALDKIAAVVQDAFPEYQVVSTYTSNFVRSKIEREEGIHILSPQEALEQAVASDVKELYVLPTHLMDGIELRKFRDLLATFAEKFEICRCAGPLLETAEDRRTIVEAVREELSSGSDVCNSSDPDHAVVLIGHGTHDAANAVYAQLQQELADWKIPNYVVGTIEATPDYEEVLGRLKALQVKSVTLVPFLVVAGDHAMNDIGGTEEDSWQSRLRAEGFAADTLQKGLGELAGVHRLLVAHVGI